MTLTKGETAARVWAPLSGYLEFEEEGPTLTRVIDGTWTFLGRVFGGYGAALLVAGSMRRSTQPALLAVNVTFLRPLVPGETEIEIEEMYAGRSAWAGRAVLRQAGVCVMLAETWFGPADSLPAAAAMPDPPPGAAPIGWLGEPFPFMNAFDEQGVDYPAGARDDPAPAPRVTLAARPHPHLEIRTQRECRLFELMLADAHMIDAAVRPHGFADVLGLSHNMTIHWTGAAESGGWLELAVEAVGDPPFAATRGELRGAGGRPVAWVLQQGRTRPLDPEGGWPA